jgi:hypothetical protein
VLEEFARDGQKLAVAQVIGGPADIGEGNDQCRLVRSRRGHGNRVLDVRPDRDVDHLATLEWGLADLGRTLLKAVEGKVRASRKRLSAPRLNITSSPKAPLKATMQCRVPFWSGANAKPCHMPT